MQDHEVYSLLKGRLEQHITLDDGLMESFENNGKIIRIPKKKLLIIPGTRDDSVYFIAKGAFLMAIVTESGESKTTSFFLDHYHDFIMCPDTVYFNTPTIYEVKAVEDAVVIKFTGEFINHLLDSNHALLKYSLQELRRDVAINSIIKDARMALSAAKFLQLLYDQYPLIFQRFPAQSIAEFMGITPVWLSKLRKKAIS